MGAVRALMVYRRHWLSVAVIANKQNPLQAAFETQECAHVDSVIVLPISEVIAGAPIHFPSNFSNLSMSAVHAAGE